LFINQFINQFLQRFLFDGITLQSVPGLVSLLQEGESVEELMRLTPEQILLRWLNFQLERVRLFRRRDKSLKQCQGFFI
jgi:hypothetical protein